MKILRGLVFGLFCTCSSVFADTPINAWINPGSAAWEDASSWSLGIRPASNQSISIANGGYKAVGISSSTVSGFPASLTVSNLSISAPSSALSVLLLNYAGTSVPLHVLDVGSVGANGSLQNFYSSLQVDGSNGVYYGGPFIIIDGGQFIQEGGLTVIKPTVELENGTINATNATMNLGALNVGDLYSGTSGNFSQSGGTVLSGVLTMDIGNYTLLGNGTLYVLDTTTLRGSSTTFNHVSGTNFGNVHQNAGVYHFYDGFMRGNDLSTAGNGGFIQDGGTADFATVEAQGGTSYSLTYMLNGGNLRCGDLYLTGLLQHWGGTLTLTNGLSLGNGRVELQGGTAFMPSMAVSNSGSYIQYSGTNQVAGDLALYNAQFVLWSGRLSSANLGVAGGGLLIQYSGSEEVSGVLSIVGSYLLNGGVLSVNGMYLRGTLSISQGGSPPASFVNNGLINFGGTLNIAASQNSMGQLGLAANGTINLQSSPLVVRFADSHALNWDSSSTLAIAGWNGLYSGNGSNQVYFGSSASGLTASQLARIQFSNPGGYDPGNYSARLLSTGELVPAVAPGPPAQTVNIWTNPISGNWEDLKWSLGVRPASGQTIIITNQGWKAVAIGSNTVQNFPETLSVSNVVLGGYTDSFNVLLLDYAGFAVPLTTALITVGTNSAVTALGSILNVSSNSGPGSLSIFSAFNQGDQAIVNAHTINLGNVTNSGAGPGIYNQTNGTINADEISEAFGSTFNQFNGSNTFGKLWMGANSSGNHGQYNMVNGYLTAARGIEMYRGDFHQTGGSVTAGLGLGDATYTLSAGTLRMQGITIPEVECSLRNPCPNTISGNATLLQTGGTNFCDGPMTVYNSRSLPGVGADFFGPGHYVLSNGVLYVSSTVSSGNYDGGGDFQQWGGWHTNAGTHVIGVDDGQLGGLRRSSFTLGGGTMVTASISIDYGSLVQSGGTNRVSGDVDVGTGDGDAKFMLSGGLLADQNTTIDLTGDEYFSGTHVLFAQSGGTHIVTNLLRVSGPFPLPYSSYPPFSSSAYVLSNGVLNAANIQIDGGGYFEHDGGTLTTSGLLSLGYATWNERTTGQQFGQLLLSAPAGTNATFSLPSANCVVRFGNSSAVAWSNQVNLLVANWNGSPNGGGQHQVIFGSNASALTPQQLSQIQFVNPAGVNGTSPARILSTGEIVPDRFLAARKSSNNLVIEWGSGTLQSATNVAGPYQDVSGATSPRTNQFNERQRFFRLRQ
jgi:hypothetical protein